MSELSKILLLAAAIWFWHLPNCAAQKKNKSGTAEKPIKTAEKVRDTIPIIYEKIPARRKTDEVFDGQSQPRPVINKNLPIVYDTVHNKPKKRQGEETILEDKKVIVIEMSKQPGPTKLGKDTPTVVISDGSCKCVNMDIKVQDTIDYENYINYRFIFTNKCKDMVMVHSGSFRFAVNDYFGHPVSRIRKVDFVKRFDYPEYVKVSPGETYEFNFADDPFFEFKMNRSQQYRFNFVYNNTHQLASDSKRKRFEPKQAHRCFEIREKMVYVR